MIKTNIAKAFALAICALLATCALCAQGVPAVKKPADVLVGNKPAGRPAIDAKTAFERLKQLAGTWEGTVVSKDGPATTVSYKVTANGNALMETQFPGTAHEMISLYHMDGDHLTLTHYCAMGNQPVMRLNRRSSTPDEFLFDFAGGTNLDPKKDTHVHSGRIGFIDKDRVENEWVVYKGEQQAGSNRFFLARKKR